MILFWSIPVLCPALFCSFSLSCPALLLPYIMPVLFSSVSFHALFPVLYPSLYLFFVYPCHIRSSLECFYPVSCPVLFFSVHSPALLLSYIMPVSSLLYPFMLCSFPVSFPLSFLLFIPVIFDPLLECSCPVSSPVLSLFCIFSYSATVLRISFMPV